MIQLLLSIGAIYGFIFLGFFAKARFKMRLDEQTLTLVSVYLLQPVMAFWGLMLRPIDLELLSAPAIYWGLTFGVLLLTLVMGRLFFADAKERAIATVSPLISNTGNLGIPLGIMLLGVESAAFTNLINLGNVFFVYTFGVYFYSRATFSIRESLTNILKMPVLWSALVAIGLNVSGAGLPPEIEQGLMMGAYASMVIQLILFGVYIYGTKGYRISRKLSIHVTGIKFGLAGGGAVVVAGSGVFGQCIGLPGASDAFGHYQCDPCSALPLPS